MLSDSTAAYLSELPFRAEAKRGACWLPLRGIYWEDEIPDLRAFQRLPEFVRWEILRLFSIRCAIWSGSPLKREDERFWEEAQREVPRYALFFRLRITPDDLEMQHEIEQESEAAFADFAAEATEVAVTERVPGVESFTLKFDLSKRDKNARLPWWKRFFHS